MSDQKENLIREFRLLQKYYQKEGDKGRTIAYGKVVNSLTSASFPITSRNDVKKLRGVGAKTLEKFDEYFKTGKIAVVESAKSSLEESKEESDILDSLKKVHGIGEKKAEELYKNGIRSVQDLRKDSVYKTLTSQQKLGVDHYEDLQKRIERKYIVALHVVVLYLLNQEFGKNSYRLEIAGSYRRGAKTSGDVDCLITTNSFRLEDVVKLLYKKKIIIATLGMKNEKFMGIGSCVAPHAFRLDIEFVKEEEYGSALLYFTGSKEFNKRVRFEAKKKGLLLNEHGLFRNGKKVLKAPTEKEIVEYLGLSLPDPEHRI